MGKLIFELSDDEREALERVRVKLGRRSHAETLRALIAAADEAPVPDHWSDEEVAAIRAKPRPALEINRIPPTAKAWKPHPKPGAKR